MSVKTFLFHFSSFAIFCKQAPFFLFFCTPWIQENHHRGSVALSLNKLRVNSRLNCWNVGLFTQLSLKTELAVLMVSCWLVDLLLVNRCQKNDFIQHLLVAFQNINSNKLPEKDGAADVSVAQNFQSYHNREAKRWRISSGLQASRTAVMFSMFSNRRHQVRAAVETYSRAQENRGGQNRKSDVASNLKCCRVVPSPAAKAKNNLYGNAGGFQQTWQLSGNWVRQLHKALPRSLVVWVSQKVCKENNSAVKPYYFPLDEIRAGFCRTGTATTLVIQVCDHGLLTRSRWTEMHPGNMKSALGPLIPT